MQVSVTTINPLRDSRWADFVHGHSRASIFHSHAWLEALRRTYGYEPVVFTSAAHGQPLDNGIVFSSIDNWLSRRRLVSLPFSDHCEPLVETREELDALLSCARSYCRRDNGGILELRPRLRSNLEQTGLIKDRQYHFHRLDLRPSLDEIFNKFHKSCIQRKIHRTEREKITCEEGRSEALLARFYKLLLLTRRRHQLPPQPIRWFRNLIGCFGGNLTIRVASKDTRPIASILTLQHKSTLVYKYGCSDEEFHNLGGMPLLFWQAMQSAKDCGITEFDLGRSDLDNPGLVAFKEHLGAKRSELCYFRIGKNAIPRAEADWKIRTMLSVFSYAPTPLMKIAGNFLYRYVG